MGRRSVAPGRVAVVVERLAALVGAGVPVVHAVSLVEGAVRGRERARLRAVRHAVASGAALSEALAAVGPGLPPDTVALVRAGEASGRLAENLAVAARALDDAVERRRRVRAAAAYPIAVLVIALLVVAVLLVTVVPRVAATVSALGGTLPPLTRAVLSVATAVGTPLGVVGVGATAMIAALLTRTTVVRAAVGALLDRLPFVGPARRGRASVAVLRTVSRLVSAGVPLLEALGLSVSATTNAAVHRGFGTLRAALRRGDPVGPALEATGLLPTWAVAVVAVADGTGDLASAFARAASVLDDRGRERGALATVALEPALMLVVGAVVGTVVVAVYLPLFSLPGLVR